MQDGNGAGYFAIQNPLEALVTLARKLDYETGLNEFILNITVSDRGDPILTNWSTLLIRIRDEDDQNPIFSQDLYEATILEEVDVSHNIAHLQNSKILIILFIYSLFSKKSEKSFLFSADWVFVTYSMHFSFNIIKHSLIVF